jgi:magnesium transporter
MDISVLNFDTSFATTKNVTAVEELAQFDGKGTAWINFSGVFDTEALKKFEILYEIHPLTIEDILSTRQQPKVETFENYRYLSLKSIKEAKYVRKTPPGKKKKEEPTEEIVIRQISIIIMKNTLITFQETAGDQFEDIRKRILKNTGDIRKMGTEYLAYMLIDTVVDEYYVSLTDLEDDIEDFEDRAIDTSNDNFIADVQDIKKYLFQIKRAMLPLRENVLILLHQIIPKANDKLKPILQDLHENLSNAIDIVESHREWLSNIMDVNLSVLSYQMNKVMKILAIVSAIFIPLTFIAGIYGMNFEFMPELSKPWGYPIVLGGMCLIGITMAIFFKIRKWF